MATFVEGKNGKWRVDICKLGFRKGRTFDSLAEAKEWASKIEAQIKKERITEEYTKLTNKDLTEIFVRAKENARQRAIEFVLTRDEVVMLYGRTLGRCQVSGIQFNTFRPNGSTKRPWYPSLDRIDSSKRYEIDNCRLVCVAVNFAMGEWGEWVLRAVADAMVLGRPGSLRNGPEAPSYAFKPIDGEPTYRQRMRRKAREIIPPQTHEVPGSNKIQ
jgi:hypothetical protein